MTSVNDSAQRTAHSAQQSDQPTIPVGLAIAANTMLPLGALVRHDGQAAIVWGVSHRKPALHLLLYEDGALRDHVLAAEIEVLNLDPKDDDRAPAGLRAWLTSGRPSIDSRTQRP
jgi:hypothetical protein